MIDEMNTCKVTVYLIVSHLLEIGLSYTFVVFCFKLALKRAQYSIHSIKCQAPVPALAASKDHNNWA